MSADKLVSFERVTCSFVDVTCSFVSLTCSFVGVTCSFARVTCSFVGVTCSFVGVTCSFDPITFRFAIPKWWILQHIYSGENSVEKRGESFTNSFSQIFVLILHIKAICIQAQTANFFTRLFTFYNMTFAVWNGSYSDAKIYMPIRMRNPTVLLL